MAATRWGILSAGKISHDFVTCLRSIKDHEVRVVAAKNVENAERFAKIHKIPKVLDNYEDMVKEDIDVVYCGSLNPQHYQLVKHLLENKIPVLCEKPLTMFYKHTEELVKIARENEVFLMEAIWSRFLPVYKELQMNIPLAGEVHQVNVTFGLKAIQEADRVMKPELGGSSILDIGVYAINFAQLVFKDEFPIEIHAVGDLNSEGVDTQASIILKYSNGKIASLSTSVLADLPCEATIFGSKANIKLEKPFWCSEALTINGKTTTIPYPETIMSCNFINSSGLRFEAMHVRECLRSGLTESPILPLGASLKISKIMQTCLEQIGAKLWTNP